MPITTTRPRSLVVATTLCLSIACALTGAVTARAGSAVGTATPMAVGGSAVGALTGADASQFYALDLQLAQKVQVSFDAPYAGGLQARLFRPGVDDASLSSTTPRNVLPLAKGVTSKTFVADWPGRWILEVSGSAAASYTIGLKQLAAGTPGRVAGATTTATANGMAVGTTYASTTFDPSNPQSAGARYAWVQATEGDIVQLAVQGTNGKPFSVEAFSPGTTDLEAASAEPVAAVRSTGLASLKFDATLDGEWVVRVVAEPDANGITKPVTFTATLTSVTPRDPATTCEDDVTDIGLVRVTGCVTTGRGQATATSPISFSGVSIIPLDGSTVRVDTQTLEVASSGTFAVDMGGMRVLPSTNYFLLKGTQTLKVPDETTLFGLPVTGSLTAAWSLEHGGTLAVTGTARLTSLGVDGDLSFTASGDLGLQKLGVRVGIEYLHGAAYSGTLRFSRELDKGQVVNVWRAGGSAAFGVAKPQWLLDREAAAAGATIAPITDSPSSADNAKGEDLPAALVGAAGSLEFRDGKFSYLQAAVNTNVPIGSTGMFITQLGASVRWNPHFGVYGHGTVALGPDINGVSALSVTGGVGWSQGGSCPRSGVDGPNWFGNGEARIAGWFSILALDACYQQSDTPYVVITGRSGFGIEGIVTGTARFDGYIYGSQAMMVEGTGELSLWGVGTEGRVILSNAGMAACGAAYIDAFGAKRRVEVGAERLWVNETGSFAFACPDFAPYRTVPLARRSTRVDGIPVTVPKGTSQVNLVVHGAGGVVSGIDIVGPDGSVVAQSSSTTAPSLTGAVFAPSADAGVMQIALPVVQAGTYLIRAQDGGAIASVQSSLPRPEVPIRARVVRTGKARFLSYGLGNLDGRRVRFVDATRASTRPLGTTAKTAGVLRLPAGSGAHRIQAIVLDARGYAQPARDVARYRGP